MSLRAIITIILVTITMPAMAEKPNIVFILADDLGAHTLSSDGNPIMETPHLDRLAQQGMKFTRGYANAATCKPSRAAIMSGQYGPRTSIYRVMDTHKGLEKFIPFIVPPNASHLAPENITLAETLKAAGYTTGHFGKWHLEKYKSYLPNTQGFDVSYESHKVHFGAKINMQKKLADDVYIGDYMTDKALDFISDSVTKKTPFFAYIPYYLIHKSYGAKTENLAEAKAEDLAYFEQKLGNNYDQKTKTVAAMTKALDDSVGRVLAHLKTLDIEDNTLVIFTSDNGGYKTKGNILNGKLRLYKGDIYEGGLRVPYIFKYPGKIAKNSQNNERIISIDLYPTIMDFAQAKAPVQELDGVSLAPLLTGKVKQLTQRSLFWFYPKWERYNKKSGKWHHNWRNVINNGQYKLIEYPDTKQVEVFDLIYDPYEQREISKAQPKLTKRLQQELMDWKSDISAHKEISNPYYKGSKQHN